MRSAALVIARALALVLGCRRTPPLPSGDVAATLVAPSAVAGARLDPATLRGKPALVMFVSATCKYCAATIPRAAAAARATGDGAVLVFVSGRAEAIASLVTTLHFPGAALVDDGTLERRYGIHAVPYTLVLGPDGRAVDALEGEQEEAALRDALVAAR